MVTRASAPKPILLIIMDGFGLSLEPRGNAISLAKTPNLTRLSLNYPGAVIQAAGTEVGLAWGEMGNSEVGHINMGSGTVVFQNLTRIDMAIKDGAFISIPLWAEAVEHVVKNKSHLHIMGLVSNGGIHSHIEHLIKVIESLRSKGFKDTIFIHWFSDGQDVGPKSAIQFNDILEKQTEKYGPLVIASICGRYYAMDKGENWDRTQKAYDCLTQNIGLKALNLREALDSSYEQGIYDEKLEPTILLDSDKQPYPPIGDNDAVIFFNFRPDRARQLTQALISPDFNKFQTEKLNNLLFISMTDYGNDYHTKAAFTAQAVKKPLAAVLADAGKKQFHIAETEKYAHVTYFFNGGTEKTYPGEDRVIIESPKVKSYDLKPEMSAYEITEEAMKRLDSLQYDFIVVNLANGDMVGHTGILEAGIKAIEVLDDCVNRLTEEALKLDGTILITADHGNVEEMTNLETNEIDKEHSTNPVPLWIISNTNKLATPPEPKVQLIPEGILADIAPTILELLGIEKPTEMTGSSLLGIIGSCPLPK